MAAAGIGHGHELIHNDTLYLCSGYFYYANQFQNSYSLLDELDTWVVIDSGKDTVDFTFTSHNFRGAVSGPMLGYISVWDNDSASGTLLVDRFSGDLSTQTLHSTTGLLYVHVHYEAYSMDTVMNTTRNLTIQWQTGGFTENPTPCYGYSGPTLTQTKSTRNSVSLKWSAITDTNIVTIDGRTFVVVGDSLNVTGLTPNTRYVVGIIAYAHRDYPCCGSKFEVYTDPLPHMGCPNVLDLHSDYVRCTYGTCINPYERVGVVDQGSGAVGSRHTLNTDTTQTDDITDNVLHTVGPGMPGSIRLGNSLYGFQAESVTYFLHIDTTLYSIILLHYAAVLQDPRHSISSQPRFTMQVLNEQNEIIDAECGAANFTANEGQGWQIGYAAKWKDWTTVGINLAPYHGQDVKLRFTTYDCWEGGHFGYAYFYADCHQPFASADQCGDVDTVRLTAPDGFRYLWYTNSASHPFDTAQTVSANTSMGDIHCRLIFIENPQCYITMNTRIDNFWPSARIDTFYTVDKGCDGYEVFFRNNSTIVDDLGTPYPGNPTCETAQWIFGDGYISSRYEPSHTYAHPGTYTVTLIAGLSGRRCTDTTSFTITTPDAWAPADQYLTCCDSLLWIDSLWYSHDTVGPTWRVAYPETCDTIYTLHLTTLPTPHFTFPSDTICYSPNYFWRGQMIPADYTLADTAHHMLTDTLVAANGCDSLVHQPLVQLPPDHLAIVAEPDCSSGSYILSVVSDNSLWHWSSSPHDSTLDGLEDAPSLMVSPDSSVVYTLTSYRNDSLFCPTIVSRTLSRPQFPHTELEVNPGVLTFDHKVLYAYDKSDELPSRHWAIVVHGATSDTVLLSGTQRRIVYTIDIDGKDSATVILSVGDGYCRDTLSQTVPIILTSIFTPNIFTPNADINNRFTAYCEGLLEGELTVFNRQGLQVFTTTDLAQGWDGTHNGTPCPQGAYVWHLRVRTADRPDDWNTHIGTVTLLR